MDELSDNDKVRIISGFIKSAPPGEFNEVFNDCRVLLQNDSLLKEKATQSFSEYDMAEYTPCKLPGAEKATLITQDGKLGGNQFVDHASNQQFNFDHLRKECRDAEPLENAVSSRVEEYRSAINEAVNGYLAQHYPAGNTAVYGKDNGGTVTIIICIEDHKFEPKNFWCGRWKSRWTVDVEGDSQCTVKGLANLSIHYYEDGNVQMHSSKDLVIKDKINLKDLSNFSSPSDLAKKVMKAIAKEEMDYQIDVNTTYDNMSSTTFKILRRPLPITRTKVDWNKIVSYRLGSELKK